MDNDRFLKQVLFGEQSEGRRVAGRPLLRYKDTCKASMENFCIDHNNWKKLPGDRVHGEPIT